MEEFTDLTILLVDDAITSYFIDYMGQTIHPETVVKDVNKLLSHIFNMEIDVTFDYEKGNRLIVTYKDINGEDIRIIKKVKYICLTAIEVA